MYNNSYEIDVNKMTIIGYKFCISHFSKNSMNIPKEHKYMTNLKYTNLYKLASSDGDVTEKIRNNINTDSHRKID